MCNFWQFFIPFFYFYTAWFILTKFSAERKYSHLASTKSVHVMCVCVHTNKPSYTIEMKLIFTGPFLSNKFTLNERQEWKKERKEKQKLLPL